MLLCDDCNQAFHMFCLRPALTEVPTGDWHCQACAVSCVMYSVYTFSLTFEIPLVLSTNSANRGPDGKLGLSSLCC